MPVSISELGTSDYCMVLWKPDRGSPDIRGNVTRVTVKCMGASEKAAFAMGVASIRWEPLFRLTTCMYVCMYNLYFRLRNTEQHSHTVLGSIDSLSLCGKVFVLSNYC